MGDQICGPLPRIKTDLPNFISGCVHNSVDESEISHDGQRSQSSIEEDVASTLTELFDVSDSHLLMELMNVWKPPRIVMLTSDDSDSQALLEKMSTEPFAFDKKN